MLDATTGYVRACSRPPPRRNSGGRGQLEKLGGAVFDLRGNSGNYLNRAIEVSDKCLGGSKVVVYTKGASDSSQYYYSTDNDSTPPSRSSFWWTMATSPRSRFGAIGIMTAAQ
jgi:hypothetical protein